MIAAGTRCFVSFLTAFLRFVFLAHHHHDIRLTLKILGLEPEIVIQLAEPDLFPGDSTAILQSSCQWAAATARLVVMLIS